MRLFSTKTIAYLIAISPLAGVFASPTSQPTPSVLHELELNARAPPPKATPLWVELKAVKEIEDPSKNIRDTFAGTLVKKETVFDVPFSDQQVQDAAIKTFDEWEKKQQQKGNSLLVALLAVPGHGLVAGTIWHGADAAFEDRVQKSAPKLAILVQRMKVRNGKQASKWHAEVVASWMAESEFPGSKSKDAAGTKWPEGTKIITYGREDKKTGFKPTCGVNPSTNNISCLTLLQAQNIKPVPIPKDCETI